MTKASDNDYPSILVTEQGSAPTTPAASHQRIYVRTSDHLLVMVNSSGTVTPVGSGLSDPMTTRGDIIVRNSSNTTARLGIGSAGKVLSSDGTDVSWQTPAASSGLLAVTRYAPASTQTPSTTSTTFADVDATNLQVTFTTPASTNILVRLSCWHDVSNTNEGWWALRESSSNIANSAVRINRAQTDEAYSAVAIYLTGVSAGSHTYKWSYAATGGTTFRLVIGDGTVDTSHWGPAIMEVWGAP